MKKILLKLQGKTVPVILGIALLLTGYMSINTIKSLEGDARVINYTGIVRGATQRLIKKELNHVPDDALIERLDGILEGLSDGSGEFNLIRLPDEPFQELLTEMKESWNEIKIEIAEYRDGGTGDRLFEMSEDYFSLADETVLAAEVYTEESVQKAARVLLCTNAAFILLALFNALFAFYQDNRRRKLQAAEEENRRKNEQLLRQLKTALIPMNEISELMYISDTENYDLLFLNEAGRKSFHVDEYEGKKCYEVLQGLNAPCPYCPIPYTTAEENYTWEFTNPITKRHYLLKDRLVEWEGRKGRIEIAFDMTDAANEKIELQNRLERDNILVECIRELYCNHDVSQATNSVLEQVGRMFQADCAYIFMIQGEHLANTALWCETGVEPRLDRMQKLKLSDFERWMKKFGNQENLVVEDLEALKDDELRPQYEFMKNHGINSAVVVPLERDGKLDGCLGVDNPDRSMLKKAVSFLQTLRYFLMLAIHRSEDEKELSRLSYYDTLTSFYNRNRYMQDIEGLTHKKGTVGVVYLDVNGLKEVNDHFGHSEGDRMLKECARTIRKSFQSGSFYRIGGDEFVVICTDIGEESFQKSVRCLKYNFNGETCQAAVGCQWAESSENINEIISVTDQLMYADKEAFYRNKRLSGHYQRHEDTYSSLTDQAVLEQRIADGRFPVYLQPKVEAESRATVGAEALVRYLGDDGNIELPDKFISILEDIPLISRIDFYVFETVCKMLGKWKREGKTLFPVSSNFSRISFMEASFADRLEAICEKYEVSKRYVEIEITEGSSRVDYGEIKAQIERLRSLGFRITVDFGIGCSNLAFLSVAAVDKLKIDKEFVKDILSNENARMVVGAMAEVCKKMNIGLMAEGVETEEQLEMVKECGVKVVQGFLFSKPVTMEKYEELIT